MKEHYLTSEAERAYRKRYYQKNRERILATAKEKRLDPDFKKRRSEYGKQYWADHREELALKAKKRRLQGALECGKIQSNMTVCQ
nr:MAG TPA: hypothetical protein [Caudoviricetes sp.]